MTNQDQLTNCSTKYLKFLNLFGFGFIVYTFSYILSTSGKFNFIICQSIQIIGMFLLFVGSVPLIKFKIENKYLQIIFPIYFFWLITIIFRGIKLDYTSVKYMFVNPNYGILLYFVPLIGLFPQKIIFYKKVFDLIIITGIFYLVCNILFIQGLLDRYNPLTQNYIETLSAISMPCAYILLTYTYHSNKKNILAGCVMILLLLFAIYRARRGLSSICLSMLISFYFMFLFHTKKKVLTTYLSFLFILLGLLYANNLYQINKKGLFGFISERGEEDTRTGVELLFYDDMTTIDWIIGKGINGEYLCPIIDESQLTNYRYYIETGYLQTILKGGIISLALYLLIAVPALILGVFYSKNMLSKASGIWIFIALISSYPTTVEGFNLQYLLVWVSIGICYSKNIRQMSDYTLKEKLTIINEK